MLIASLAPLDETITIAELTRDPYPIDRRLRREAPILRVKSVGRTFLTKAADTDDDAEEAASALVGGKSLWMARVSARSQAKPGQTIELGVDTRNLQFFDPAGGLSIGHPKASADLAEQSA